MCTSGVRPFNWPLFFENVALSNYLLAINSNCDAGDSGLFAFHREIGVVWSFEVII